MAYDTSREQNIEAALVKRNERGEYFRVARVIPEGKRLESIDIRQMYTRDDGDVSPTQKGVRINSELLYEVMKGVVIAMNDQERDELAELLEQASENKLTYDVEKMTKETKEKADLD